jgi:hypothetical protein
MERTDNEIQNKILKLAQLLLHTDSAHIPTPLIQNAFRHLRYQNNSSLSLSQKAIKIRLRQIILSKYSYDQNGPVNVAHFDQEVDSLQKKSSVHLNSFLILLQPLSFCRQSNSENLYFNMSSLSTAASASAPDSSPATPKTALATGTKGTNSGQPVNRLPIGIPPALNEEELTLLNDHTLWISQETEHLLLRDLLLIFQVWPPASLSPSLSLSLSLSFSLSFPLCLSSPSQPTPHRASTVYTSSSMTGASPIFSTLTSPSLPPPEMLCSASVSSAGSMGGSWLT